MGERVNLAVVKALVEASVLADRVADDEEEGEDNDEDHDDYRGRSAPLALHARLRLADTEARVVSFADGAELPCRPLRAKVVPGAITPDARVFVGTAHDGGGMLRDAEETGLEE